MFLLALLVLGRADTDNTGTPEDLFNFALFAIFISKNMSLTKAERDKIEEEEKYRVQVRGKLSQPFQTKTRKSRIVAAVLAILFGDLGLHKFYLGRPTLGLFYLFFSWTFIPLILGFIEGLMYLSMSDKSFEAKYL